MLAKSLTLASDNITYDLEDSVTPSTKAAARAALRSHLASLASRPPGIGELAVRINAVSSPHALEDLTALAALPNLDTLVIPKVNSPSDLTFVTDVLRHAAPDRYRRDSSEPGAAAAAAARPLKLLALIESARAVMDLREICSAAATPPKEMHLDGLIFAAEDFALDLSLTRTPALAEFLYARSAVATAARAFSLPSTIDLVCTSYRGADALRTLEEECRNGKGMGFNGKRMLWFSSRPSFSPLLFPLFCLCIPIISFFPILDLRKVAG